MRKEEQGRKRNLELRGKRAGYSDEVKNKLFLQSALLEHTRELDIQELHADTTRISLTYEKSVGTYYHSPNAEID